MGHLISLSSFSPSLRWASSHCDSPALRSGWKGSRLHGTDPHACVRPGKGWDARETRGSGTERRRGAQVRPRLRRQTCLVFSWLRLWVRRPVPLGRRSLACEIGAMLAPKHRHLELSQLQWGLCQMLYLDMRFPFILTSTF